MLPPVIVFIIHIYKTKIESSFAHLHVVFNVSVLH